MWNPESQQEPREDPLLQEPINGLLVSVDIFKSRSGVWTLNLEFESEVWNLETGIRSLQLRVWSLESDIWIWSVEIWNVDRES